MAAIRVADAVTLIGAGIAGASIVVSILGYVDLALRLLFLAYFFDIMDGVIARRMGSSSEYGLMLDRAVDRVSQVIAPLVIYTSWISRLNVEGVYLLALAVYTAIIVPTALYRLVYRVVRSLRYFHGLPLFFHAGILLTAILSGKIINPAILLFGAIMTAIPVKYYRRHSEKTPSPAPWLRAGLVLLMALLPYDVALITWIANIVFYALIAYAVIGPIIYLILYNYRFKDSKI